MAFTFITLKLSWNLDKPWRQMMSLGFLIGSRVCAACFHRGLARSNPPYSPQPSWIGGVTCNVILMSLVINR